MTALMYAAAQDYKDVVKALVKHGANVNAVSDNNQTALMWAAASGFTDVAKALLKAGADPNIAMKDPGIDSDPDSTYRPDFDTPTPKRRARRRCPWPRPTATVTSSSCSRRRGPSAEAAPAALPSGTRRRSPGAV